MATVDGGKQPSFHKYLFGPRKSTAIFQRKFLIYPQPFSYTIMVTIEQLYKDYEVLAEAGAEAGQHEKSYASILSAVGGDSPQKQLAGQFIPKFFKYFPSLAEQAINAQLDLCEDDVSMIRRQAIKELPNLCRNNAEHLLRIADVLTQLLQSDDLPELNIVRTALMALYNIDAKGTLGGIFNQILSGEDKVRDRAIKFLSNKIQTLPADRIPKDVEEFLVEKSKEVLADVTGEEFVIFMKLLTGLTTMQTLVGRKQLLDLVTEQADLTSDFQHTDSDSVDRLMQCIRQAMPFFSKNVQSTAFLSYICEHVLPKISSLASSPDENGAAEGEEKKDKEKESDSEGAKLEMLKLLAEMAANCGDVTVEPHISNLFSTLVEYMPLPPPVESEDSENTPASEGPQLQFSYVECLMYTFHQLARRHPEFLTGEEETVVERLKDFRLRLQYFARGVQLYKRQLRLALQGKTGDQLKTDENKLKVVALRITSNIDILTKDLFHNPPSYKNTVILSWRPVNKQPPAETKEQPGQKRSNITPISFPEGSTPAKKKTQNRGGGGGGGGQRKGNRGMYAPPSGKYSQKAGSAPGGGDANYGDNYGGKQRYQQNQRGRGGYGRNRGRGRGRYY